MCRAVLELYVNGTLELELIDEDWSYFWRISRCPAADGRDLLVAASISDNDWTHQTLLLSRSTETDNAGPEDKFTVLADLAELTRQDEMHPENLLSGWARSGAVSAVGENTFTLCWTGETRCTGNLVIPVTYQVQGNQVKQQEDPCKLMNSGQEWTAWVGFDVMEEAGSENIGFSVVPEEKVYLTEICRLDGKIWLKCIDRQGREGWFPEPDEQNYELVECGEEGEDYYRYGYFEESIFAG